MSTMPLTHSLSSHKQHRIQNIWAKDIWAKTSVAMQNTMSTGDEREYFIRDMDAPQATFSVFIPCEDEIKGCDNTEFEHIALSKVWKFFEKIQLDPHIEVGVDSRWLEYVTFKSVTYVRICGTMRVHQEHAKLMNASLDKHM